MTPEAEHELLEFLEDVKRQRSIRPPPAPNGDELRALRSAVLNVGDNVSRLLQEYVKGEARTTRRFERHHDRIARLENPGRAPMPSISADDSGSIDISTLGGSLKLRGPLPVRAAIAIVLASLLIAGGWVARTAIANAPPTPQGAGQAPTHGAP